jgi:glycosyltransferase involved in cell wall biosynthesis
VKVSILIPVFEEAATVGELLERVCAQPIDGCLKELVIIESNSTDGSRRIVEEFVGQLAGRPQQAGLQVQLILEQRPMGKGHAIRRGLAAARGEIILIQDADLEYEVSDYPELLRPIVEGRTHFVLGSRHMGTRRWSVRQFGDRSLQALAMNFGGMLFHGFFNLVYGVRLTDPTTMFKVFRAECLRGLALRCNRFDFDFELVGSLLRAGFSPLEVPVSYRSRGFDAGKKIRVLRDPWGWVLTILRCRLRPLTAESPRYRHPRRTCAPSPANNPPDRSPRAAAYSRYPR